MKENEHPRFYTAESVMRGHPDKLCDLIADSVLDECLKHDPASRVACEVMATDVYKRQDIFCGSSTGDAFAAYFFRI